MPQSDQFVSLFALSAVLLSGPSCANPAEAVAAQQTPSIGASFDAIWMAARDRPFEEQQAIWDQVIEQPRQDVYASVVWEERDHARWKEAKEQLLRRRFAVDTLVLEHADMSVLFPHELFHLYHAEHAGIQNDGVMAGADLTLPLFAEGLATYVSSVLSSGHSDGQLLLQNDLGALPVARLPEIAGRFLADADKKAIDPAHPEAFGRWFMGSKAKYQPDLPNRAGYWLGFHVIRQMRRHYTLREVASWSPSKAQMQTRAALLQMAQGDRAGAG
jgi:hypothetical protein